MTVFDRGPEPVNPDEESRAARLDAAYDRAVRQMEQREAERREAERRHTGTDSGEHHYFVRQQPVCLCGCSDYPAIVVDQALDPIEKYEAAFAAARRRLARETGIEIRCVGHEPGQP